MDMTIRLDTAHRYWRGDQLIPGTNEVIDTYFEPCRFFTEDGRDKGLARHIWFHFLVQGQEPDSEPDPRIASEVASFRSWLSEVKPVYIGGELPFFDSNLNVCGTPDIFAEIFGVLSVVDFKPAARATRTRLQTAAYKLNLIANGIPIVNRYELRLSDGKYRFEKHEDRGDEARWRAMVQGFHAASFYNR